MSWLIDFSPLKTGGGVQLALNFIEFLKNSNEIKNIYFLVPQNGLIRKELDDLNPSVLISSPSTNMYKRFYFERFVLPRIIKTKGIEKSFTFFGPGLPSTIGVTQIISVAYPIICYDESFFWTRLPLIKRWRYRLKNFVRKLRIQNAACIIVETEVMRSRVANTLKYPLQKIEVIPPVPTNYITEGFHQSNRFSKFLVLSGPSIHKNLDVLYHAAVQLKIKKINLKFVISITEIEFKKLFIEKISNEILVEYFDFIGVVNPKELDPIYKSVDFSVNLSDLESFSNNYLEAWKAGIPLLLSDRDFSRSICGDSGVYCEPHNLDSVLFRLIELVRIPDKEYQNMISDGKNRLKYLPTLDQKFSKLNSLLELY